MRSFTGRMSLRSDAGAARMLDMDDRLRGPRLQAFGVLAVALLATGPWVGWWTAIALLPAGGVFAIGSAVARRIEQPKYVLSVAWAFSVVLIAVCVFLSGGPHQATMSWFTIPIVTLSARFSVRGVTRGVLFALALILAVNLAFGLHTLTSDPPLFVGPAAAVIAIAILNTALMRSEVEHRTGALVDELLGLLNLRGVRGHAEELRQQSVIRGFCVGVLMIDLDKLKRVNDVRGHPAGNELLMTASELLSESVRHGDTVGRLGGDEFVILLPDSDLAATTALAERLRKTFAAQSHEATMTIGVSIAPAGTPFDFDTNFAAADAALLWAKDRGRNLVAVATAPLAGIDSPIVPAAAAHAHHRLTVPTAALPAARNGAAATQVI
jgi:diguanylate cyclase (GGDEF)-like protein